MSIDEMIAVLQAAKEGKQIQMRSDADSEWADMMDVSDWSFPIEYRIKPREWWFSQTATTKGLITQMFPYPTGAAGEIHVQEVLKK